MRKRFSALEIINLLRAIEVKISGGMGTEEACRGLGVSDKSYYRWRALDHEGEVLEVVATQRRDRRAALRFLQRTMQRYGRPAWIVTDRLGSSGAAMKDMGVEDCQLCGQWLNNRAANSPQPFRRRDGAMARFRDIKTLQQFASVHVPVHHHFNHQRHLNRRDIFTPAHAAALAEWRQLAA